MLSVVHEEDKHSDKKCVWLKAVQLVGRIAMNCADIQICSEIKNNFTSLVYLQTVTEMAAYDAIKCRVM
jgi:hypothetical protein